MIEDEIDKDLTRELLEKQTRGEIKLPRYKVDGLITKFVHKKDDSFAVAREIAKKVAGGCHTWDLTIEVRLLAPDVPKEELKILAVDVFVKAAAITIAEEIKGWRDSPMSRKEVEELYIDGILSTSLIKPVTYEKAKRIVSKGIDYHLVLLGKGIKKKRLRIFQK